jgi:hypothetical protein
MQASIYLINKNGTNSTTPLNAIGTVANCTTLTLTADEYVLNMTMLYDTLSVK